MMHHENRLLVATNAVISEYWRAHEKFGSFNSPHEGYAVMLEEVDELWHEIKHGTERQRIFDEAKQVAAMAIRLMIQYGGKTDPTKGDGND